MDFKQLNMEELQVLRTAKQREIARAENQQMAIKILMNSLYGALG
jgi:DNA polymerase elongation subunit (family B)